MPLSRPESRGDGRALIRHSRADARAVSAAPRRRLVDEPGGWPHEEGARPTGAARTGAGRRDGAAQVPKTEMKGATWTQVGGWCQLRITLKGGTFLRFDGFPPKVSRRCTALHGAPAPGTG